MGGTTSKSDYSSFNQSLVDIMFHAMQKCATKIEMEQVVDVQGDYNDLSGIRMAQGIQYQINCNQMQQSIAEIRNDMANAIQQEAKATGQMAQFGNTDAESRVSIASQVSNSVTMDSMNELMTTVNMKQLIKVNGRYNLLRNFDMQQTSKLVADAAQKILSKIDAVTKLDNIAKQVSTSETKNFFSFLTDWLGNLGMLGIAVIIGIVVLAYLFISGGGLSLLAGDDDEVHTPSSPAVTK